MTISFKDAHPNPPADQNKAMRFKVGDKAKWLAQREPNIWHDVTIIACLKRGYRVLLPDGQTRIANDDFDLR